MAKFQSILGEGGVVDDSTALEAANEYVSLDRTGFLACQSKPQATSRHRLGVQAEQYDV